MLLSKIPVKLFLPSCYLARFGGGEARQQQPPLFLDFFLSSSGMTVSNGLPEPALRRLGQL